VARQVKAFAYEGLPTVPAMSVARSRALARALASSGGQGAISARGLGRVQLAVERVDASPWRGDPGGHPSPESGFMLVQVDGSFGCVTVERFFALGLVRLALGAPAPPVLRPLSPSERGVLGAIVASVLAAAGGSTRVSLERPRSPEGDYVAMNLLVRTPTLSGGALVEIPVSWLPSTAAGLPADASWLLETVLVIEAGRTSLAGGAFATTEVGDVVVFEGVSALRDDSPWPCEIRLGANRAPARLLSNGELRLDGAFVLGPPGTDAADMSDEHDPRAGRPGEGGFAPEAAAVLASAPVEIVAEIGRVPLRGDEVLGLTNGSVLPLGPRRRDLVTLRVGGRVWARGELVHIEEELGVRITEVLRPR
jgi:type III secretion system YscQ/HrcQ family protein